MRNDKNNTSSKQWFARTGLAVLCFGLLSGCSTFKGSREIDMAPFSDNTRILFGEAVIVSRPFQWKYLKPYSAIPEYDAIVAAGVPLKLALRDIVYYSNQVVAIRSSALSEGDKNSQLSQYIAAVLERSTENSKSNNLQLSEADVSRILEDIRRAETYLNGVKLATPIVQHVALAVHDRIDELQDLVPGVVNGIDQQLDMEFGTTRTNYDELIGLRDELMLAVTRLYGARIGDRSKLDAMLQENASIRQFFNSSDATADQLSAAENFLLQQLREIDGMLGQLDDAKAELLAKQNELIEWQTHVDRRLGIAREAVTIWAQSHQNLGNGIAVPPLFDLSSLASKLAGDAVSLL